MIEVYLPLLIAVVLVEHQKPRVLGRAQRHLYPRAFRTLPFGTINDEIDIIKITHGMALN
jgi:hypothetical protein